MLHTSLCTCILLKVCCLPPHRGRCQLHVGHFHLNTWLIVAYAWQTWFHARHHGRLTLAERTTLLWPYHPYIFNSQHTKNALLKEEKVQIYTVYLVSRCKGSKVFIQYEKNIPGKIVTKCFLWHLNRKIELFSIMITYLNITFLKQTWFAIPDHTKDLKKVV